MVGYVDADAALSCSEILKVFRGVNEDTNVAIASRWVKGSRILIRQPLIRVILGRLYHYISFFLFGLEKKDIQCGLKSFHRDVLEDIFGNITVKNLSLDTASLYLIHLSVYRVTELLVAWKDVNGSKVISSRVIFFMYITIIGRWLAHTRIGSFIGNSLKNINDAFGLL